MYLKYRYINRQRPFITANNSKGATTWQAQNKVVKLRHQRTRRSMAPIFTQELELRVVSAAEQAAFMQTAT
jgi:hypothetical protein